MSSRFALGLAFDFGWFCPRDVKRSESFVLELSADGASEMSGDVED